MLPLVCSLTQMLQVDKQQRVVLEYAGVLHGPVQDMFEAINGAIWVVVAIEDPVALPTAQRFCISLEALEEATLDQAEDGWRLKVCSDVN